MGLFNFSRDATVISSMQYSQWNFFTAKMGTKKGRGGVRKRKEVTDGRWTFDYCSH